MSDPMRRRATLPPNADNPEGYQVFEDYFVYGVTFASIAAGALQTQNIQIQADSAFKWTHAAMECDLAGVTYTEEATPVPLCALQITDSGTGRQLFSQAIPVNTVFGSGKLPFVLPVPRGFKPNSNITLALSNFAAAQTYTVRLSLIGSKVFPRGGSMP